MGSYDEATAFLKSSEENYDQINQLKGKYLRKYRHYQAKASCFLQQLSFVP